MEVNVKAAFCILQRFTTTAHLLSEANFRKTPQRRKNTQKARRYFKYLLA